MSDELDDLAGRIGDDDNVDPRKFFDRRQQRKGGRKALQLCRQVQKALSYALSECDDDALGALYVESVAPAPNDRRLMVTVSSMGEELEPADVLMKLQFATPFLREQVGNAIHRKRVPELIFQCVPTDAGR